MEGWLPLIVRVLSSTALLLFPVFTGVFGLVLSNLFQWEPSRFPPWLIRGLFAAVGAPTLAVEHRRLEPVPMILVRLLAGESLPTLTLVISVLSPVAVLLGVLSYYWLRHR